MTSQIIISDIGIRQDSCGRYSLNDLHKSAGGLPKHAPAQWLRIDQATDLINAIINMQICTFKPVDSYKGRYGGTYVCKELVYAYATWISPEFFLKVIRAYDALVTGNTKKAEMIAKTTVDERTPLRDAVNLLVSKRHIMYPEAYAMIHQRFNVESIEDLSAELISQAIEYAHRVALDGEFIGKEANVKHRGDYNFPLSSADPTGRKSGNVWMTPKVILDENNPAPELELLDRLERDGYCVDGVRLRIHSMYLIAKYLIEMQAVISSASTNLRFINDALKSQSRERGTNVVFNGSGHVNEGPIGGLTERRLPR